MSELRNKQETKTIKICIKFLVESPKPFIGYFLYGFSNCVFCLKIPFYLHGGPIPVINGVKWGPYKWPEMNGQLGL